MDLTRDDIDQLIQDFSSNPSQELYSNIDNWYEDSVDSYPDGEYMVCIYLFLVGANIKHRYKHIGYEQHMAYVKEIRDIIENASPLARSQRKVYLDFGTKSR